MSFAPSSPGASLYDISDEEEGEYNTIKRSKVHRGVKLLFSKSKVYVHPTQSAKDNLPGFIALVQQKATNTHSQLSPRLLETTASVNGRPSSSSHRSDAHNLLLAWIPESILGDAYETYVKVDLSESADPPKQSYLVPPPPTISAHTLNTTPGTYAFAIPVSEIFSLLVRPPSLGWWFGSVVINTRAGDSFPALFFHDDECQSTLLQRKRRARESFDPFGEGGQTFWGGDEVVRWLRQYVNVERAEHEMNVYLVEPSEEDKIGFGVAARNAGTIVQKGKNASQRDRRQDSRGSRDAAMDPVTRTLKEARWGLLEKFAQVTTFARRTAQTIADHPNMPPQARRVLQNPEVQTIQEEFDSARLYLARWAMGIAEQSEREKNQRIWTAKDVLEMEETPVGDFEILDMQAGGMSLKDKRKPVTLGEWESWFDLSGRLSITVDEVKERLFHGGCDPDDGVRKEVWPFLLGVHSWHSSKAERQQSLSDRREEYVRLKARWWERSTTSNQDTDEAEWWKEQRLRIEKDVHRTDRQVPLFAGEDIPHPDPESPFAEVGSNVHLEQLKDILITYDEFRGGYAQVGAGAAGESRFLETEGLDGYVQGMSDLLAPVYAVCEEDALAFWCFVGLMKRVERNFHRSQKGMHAQLQLCTATLQLLDPQLSLHLESCQSGNFFFLFRPLLVQFKREFPFDDILSLWERLWSDYHSSQFHIFFALAVLERHRSVILTHLKAFDEVLKYVNDLAGNIDLGSSLVMAEGLHQRMQKTVEAIDKKEGLPAPQTEAGRGSPPRKDVVVTEEMRRLLRRDPVWEA
ncbi:MAG: hypothetical protein Q9162_005608 [Coniocarpon cinnabarinum]